MNYRQNRVVMFSVKEAGLIHKIGIFNSPDDAFFSLRAFRDTAICAIPVCNRTGQDIIYYFDPDAEADVSIPFNDYRKLFWKGFMPPFCRVKSTLVKESRKA